MTDGPDAQPDTDTLLVRGFVLARDEQGSIIKESSRLQPGQTINLSFRDGRATCQVKQIQKRS